MESALSAARSQLESTQRSLSEREAELSSLRSASGQSELFASSRTSELESQLAALRSESTAASTTVAELQSELSAARAKVDNLEERVKGKPNPKCAISVEDGGKTDGADGPLFPGVLENGRSVKFSWNLSGNVRIQWFRSFRGSAWELIPGKNATKPAYTVSADDIGACLRAEATSTVNGSMVYAEAGPVHPSTGLIVALQEPLRKLDASFTVESGGAAAGGEADRKRGILLNKEKIKLQDAKGKTVAKKEWGEHVKVTLDGDSERRFSVQIESNGPVVPYAAANQRMRDLVVVALRSFIYVITKHGGRLNKDLDHLMALSLHIRTLNEQTYNRSMAVVPASPAKRQPSISQGAGKAPLPPGSKGAAGGQPTTTPSKQRTSDAAQGSAPSTPVSHSAATPQQPGADASNRRQSGGGEDEWGGFSLQPSAGSSGNIQSGAAAASNSNGAVRKNAEGQEVDDQGFIVTKNRGFDESPAYQHPLHRQRSDSRLVHLSLSHPLTPFYPPALPVVCFLRSASLRRLRTTQTTKGRAETWRPKRGTQTHSAWRDTTRRNTLRARSRLLTVACTVLHCAALCGVVLCCVRVSGCRPSKCKSTSRAEHPRPQRHSRSPTHTLINTHTR